MDRDRGDLVDAVVVGAGPAGLAAASLLAEHGAEVVLADEHNAPGGQIYRQIEHIGGSVARLLGPDFAFGAATVRRFRESRVRYLPGSSVWQLAPGHEVWLSREGRSICLTARTVVIATGAMERPVPVPGWTLPGVMTAGALQILLKAGGAVATAPLALAGSGPLFLLLAQQCLDAGANVVGLLDTTSWGNQLAALPRLARAFGGVAGSYVAKGLALKRRLERSGVPIHRFVHGLHIEGEDEVRSVSFTGNGLRQRLDVRLVALHEGVIPSQQMARSIGCAFDWDEAQACFRPVLDGWGESSVDGVFIVGDAGGIGGGRAAEHSGRLTALAILHRLGRVTAATRETAAAAERAAMAAQLRVRGFLDRLYAPRREIRVPADEVTICRCEEVTAGALRQAVAAGCQGPNQAKAFLRCGMGPCQGRMCGPAVTEVIAAARRRPPSEVGYFRIRPPLKPVTVGELAQLDVS